VKLCVICGASVKNHNPKTTTCQPLCTRAKHNKRSHQEQVAYELAHPDFDFDTPINANNWDEPVESL